MRPARPALREGRGTVRQVQVNGDGGSDAEEEGPGVFALTVVKDEADIIELCLRHASRFCRKIFVLDNGSSDGTWEIVRRLAGEIAAVTPVGRQPGPFGRGMKGLVFGHARPHLENGDWVLILDADEFLEQDPRPRLRRCRREGWDHVLCLQAQFFVTPGDLDAAWFLSDAPVEDFTGLPRHYRIDWEEPRLFRYDEALRWRAREEDGSWSDRLHPGGLERPAPFRLVNRHYQYRSRWQMERRVRSRARAYRECGAFPHSVDTDWSKYVRDPEELSTVQPGDTVRATPLDRFRVWCRRTKKRLPARLKRAVVRRVDDWAAVTPGELWTR